MFLSWKCISNHDSDGRDKVHNQRRFHKRCLFKRTLLTIEKPADSAPTILKMLHCFINWNTKFNKSLKAAKIIICIWRSILTQLTRETFRFLYILWCICQSAKFWLKLYSDRCIDFGHSSGHGLKTWQKIGVTFDSHQICRILPPPRENFVKLANLVCKPP